ncbi:MAG: alpha/beta fold hydrolase [Pseudomonadales bacterium]
MAPQLPWEVHPGRGPHLLLVHGFLSSPSQWQPNLAALADCCTPVTVTLWGHAGAPSPTDPAAYHPDAYVARFEEIRAALGVERWLLLGYSLGAGLTMRYAFTCPGQVLGHGLTNSSSALADNGQIRAWRESGAESAQRIRAGGLAAMRRIPVHPLHARRLPQPVYEALRRDAERHDPEGIARTIEHTTPELSLRHRLAENRRPALLLCGTRERRFQAHRAYLPEHMPLLDVADLDAGHAVNMEAATAFNESVTRFVQRF